MLTFGEYARALLYNGLGQLRGRARAPRSARSDRDELMVSFAWSLPELVEAAARSGETELAADALERLAERTRAGGTDWRSASRRVRAPSSATAAPPRSLYREAIERLGRCRLALDLARAHLLYGEWLRREQPPDRRPRAAAHRARDVRVDGRRGVRRARRRELLATGETVRATHAPTHATSSPRRRRRSPQLARDGLSNPEIGARLFISPRTVQYHLHKVFTKLDITSRNELVRRCPGIRRPPSCSS